MKKFWDYTVAIIVILFCSFVFITVCVAVYKKRQIPKEIVREIKITQQQIDSIKATVLPIEKEVIKYEEKKEDLKKREQQIVYDTINCKEIVDNLKEQIENLDSLSVKKDSIIYLDREIIKKQYVIMDKMVLPKNKKWSVGVQLGVTTDGRKAVPYVGIGVQRDLFRF